MVKMALSKESKKELRGLLSDMDDLLKCKISDKKLPKKKIKKLCEMYRFKVKWYMPRWYIVKVISKKKLTD